MAFTAEEKTIIKMYSDTGIDRDALLSAMDAALPHVEDKEVVKALSGLIHEVKGMTGAEVQAIDLSDALESEDGLLASQTAI